MRAPNLLAFAAATSAATMLSTTVIRLFRLSSAADEKITFNAGTHRDAIRMGYRGFERLVKPRVVELCKHE